MVHISAKAFVLLSLGAEVLAGNSTAPSVTCATAMDTVSVEHPPTTTATETTTITITEQVNESQQQTVTPTAETVTVTNTDTATSTHTADQNTKTATSTITNTATITQTDVETTLVTETITSTVVSTSTYTTPAPAGFTPFAADANNAASGKRGLSPLVRRHNVTDTHILMSGANKKKEGHRGSKCRSATHEYNPARYPQSVDCVQTITRTETETTTKTVEGSTITLQPETSSVTTEVTTTVTTTQYPADATSTVTTQTDVTTQVTETNTVTQTTTSTATVQSVVPTSVYGACLPDNLMNAANGNKDTDTIYYNGVTPAGVNVRSAYDCCVACFTTFASTCVGSDYYQQCEILQTNTCSPGVASPNEYFTGPTSSGSAFTFSNGPCGRWTNGGTHN